MKYQLLMLSLVLLGFVGFSQALAQNPTTPPYTTPPTFPEGHADPRKDMPPDQEVPPPKRSSNEKLEKQIQHKLNSETGLNATNVAVKVDEGSIVLTGVVNTDEQHDLALRIARSYAEDRKIVDKIALRKQT